MATFFCLGCTQRERRIGELEKSNARLQAECARLKAQLDEAQRSSKRQAAPFSKGEPKKNPRPTARPKGAAYGKHGQRLPPPADQIDQTLEAPLHDHCPFCGGGIAEE